MISRTISFKLPKNQLPRDYLVLILYGWIPAHPFVKRADDLLHEIDAVQGVEGDLIS